jgi:hypothetical protein
VKLVSCHIHMTYIANMLGDTAHKHLSLGRSKPMEAHILSTRLICARAFRREIQLAAKCRTLFLKAGRSKSLTHSLKSSIAHIAGPEDDRLQFRESKAAWSKNEGSFRLSVEVISSEAKLEMQK